MEHDRVDVRLNAQEWRLVSALRDIPPSPLRDLVHELMKELIDYVREPRCGEIQADGVPCESPAADCEQCVKVKGLLLGFRHRIGNPRARKSQ